jgi:hypothetical protein
MSWVLVRLSPALLSPAISLSMVDALAAVFPVSSLAMVDFAIRRRGRQGRQRVNSGIVAQGATNGAQLGKARGAKRSRQVREHNE